MRRIARSLAISLAFALSAVAGEGSELFQAIRNGDVALVKLVSRQKLPSMRFEPAVKAIQTQVTCRNLLPALPDSLHTGERAAVPGAVRP